MSDETTTFERLQRVEAFQRAEVGRVEQAGEWMPGYVLQRYPILTALDGGEMVYTYWVQLDDAQYGVYGAGELRAESKERLQAWLGITSKDG